MYKPLEPTIGDNRYKNFRHKHLLDTLRIIHFNHFGKDPSIQYLQADDGYSTMFQNGRFLATSWYKIRDPVQYTIQFSNSIRNNFTGSILLTFSTQYNTPFNSVLF